MISCFIFLVKKKLHLYIATIYWGLPAAAPVFAYKLGKSGGSLVN
jgi:hypothetical protein